MTADIDDTVQGGAGLQLSQRFYTQVIASQLSGIPHSAALLGWGSDVLGYDTARSTDHGWGPRVLVFTDQRPPELELPVSFDGVPVHFGWAGVEPRSWVTVTRLDEWLLGQLGVDATGEIDVLDWLLIPQQRLLGVTAGAVFADPDGSLVAVRSTLTWYPDEVWRWLLACQWQRIAQEEAFVARTAEVGDATGSRVVAARQVRELMRLALLLARRYAPYQKWLGTAFARVTHDDDLPALLAAGVTGDQHALGAAYLALATRQDAIGLAAPVRATLGDYYDRPARVIMAGRFADALRATITDPLLGSLPLIGSVDQFVDSTDVLERPELCRRLARLYRPRADRAS